MSIRHTLAAALCLLAAGAAPAQDATRPADTYLRVCSACHGERGNGDSHAASALASRPRDFTSEEARLTLTRPYMIAIVRDGRPHTAMVGRNERLSHEAIEGVVDFIRTAFIRPDPATPLGRGYALYRQSCLSCHGDRGKGGPRRGAVEAAPAIATGRARPDLDAAAMTAAVARRPHAPGMPAGDLAPTPEAIAEVVSYVRSAFIDTMASRSAAPAAKP